MQNKFLFYILFGLLSTNIVFAGISVNPSSWDTTLQHGQTESKVFVFNQTTENTTTSLALTKTGANSDWLNFSVFTFCLPGLPYREPEPGLFQ